MTDESNGPGDREQRARPEWVDEAEDALERAGDALRTAWEETRESRMSALDSARRAAEQLAEAIDRGVDAARSRWQSGTAAPKEDVAPPAGEPGAEDE